MIILTPTSSLTTPRQVLTGQCWKGQNYTQSVRNNLCMKSDVLSREVDMLYKGTMALEMWCRRVCEGYPGVEIKNMDESWRDGLAFCAILHKYRPDLIAWQECRKGDTARNCSLAFGIAESHLAIPALLDTQDMLNTNRLDRLSILTYLSEMYHALEGKKKMRTQIRKESSLDSGISSSSSSSGSSSPARELQEITQTRRRPESVDYYREESSITGSATNHIVISNRDTVKKTDEGEIVNSRLESSSLSSPEASIQENSGGQDSVFAVGFRKFSNLAMSTQHTHRTGGVNTRTIHTQTDKRDTFIQTDTVSTQTDTDRTQSDYHSIQTGKSMVNLHHPISEKMSKIQAYTISRDGNWHKKRSSKETNRRDWHYNTVTQHSGTKINAKQSTITPSIIVCDTPLNTLV